MTKDQAYAITRGRTAVARVEISASNDETRERARATLLGMLVRNGATEVVVQTSDRCVSGEGRTACDDEGHLNADRIRDRLQDELGTSVVVVEVFDRYHERFHIAIGNAVSHLLGGRSGGTVTFHGPAPHASRDHERLVSVRVAPGCFEEEIGCEYEIRCTMREWSGALAAEATAGA